VPISEGGVDLEGVGGGLYVDVLYVDSRWLQIAPSPHPEIPFSLFFVFFCRFAVVSQYIFFFYPDFGSGTGDLERRPGFFLAPPQSASLQAAFHSSGDVLSPDIFSFRWLLS